MPARLFVVGTTQKLQHPHIINSQPRISGINRLHFLFIQLPKRNKKKNNIDLLDEELRNLNEDLKKNQNEQQTLLIQKQQRLYSVGKKKVQTSYLKKASIAVLNHSELSLSLYIYINMER